MTIARSKTNFKILKMLKSKLIKHEWWFSYIRKMNKNVETSFSLGFL